MRPHPMLLTAAVASLLCGCHSDAPKPYEEIRPVWTVVAGRTPGSVGAVYSGEVRARYESRLGFRTGGKIVTRLVEVGSHVYRGQPLMTLDPEQETLQVVATSADVDAANSRLAQARIDLKRAEQLLARQFASQAEVDQLRLALEQAEAQERSASAQHALSANQRSFTTLTADRDGVVTGLAAEAGQVVAAGQPVATVAGDGEREVAVSVPESRVDELRTAGTLQVTLWSEQGKSWTGRLRELAPDTDSVTRTYAARITIVDADPSDIRLGMTASVHVANVAGASAIRLPLTAIVDRGAERDLWIVDPKSWRVALQPVTVGNAQNDNVIVLSGLQGGEQVVTAGVHMLQPGQRVAVVPMGTTQTEAAR